MQMIIKDKTQDLKTQLKNKKIEMETLKNAQKIKSSPLFQILFGVSLGASLIAFIIICIKCKCRPKLKRRPNVQEDDSIELAIDFCDKSFAASIHDIKFEELKKQKLKNGGKKKKKKKKKKEEKSYFSGWFS